MVEHFLFREDIPRDSKFGTLLSNLGYKTFFAMTSEENKYITECATGDGAYQNKEDGLIVLLAPKKDHPDLMTFRLIGTEKDLVRQEAKRIFDNYKLQNVANE
jgi:hypothetical protein